MLKKLDEIKITAEAPFANDAAERKQPIERLTYLVESTEQPFVLSIEAPWGWGKTTFVRMWKAHLESKGHICLHFNAWENDFVDDPLVAFLGEMRGLIEKETKSLNETEPLKKYWGVVKGIGAGVLRKGFPLAVQMVTHGVLSQEAIKQAAGALAEKTDEIAEFASTLAKDRLEKYESEREGIRAFRSNLEKLAEEVITKGGRKSPLVFFIDELDRCRPDFAVALLERIKHLFNVPRVVFVLAVAREQLNQSVKALYGLEMDPDGYLRRFIDLAYSLPPPTTRNFVESLSRRFGMGECFNQRGGEIGRIWLTAFAHYADVLKLSLRAQEQCFTEMNIVLRTVPQEQEIIPAVLSMFSALRAYRPTVIRELRERRLDVDTVIGWFAAVDDPWYRLWPASSLILAFAAEDQKEKRLESLKQRILKEGVGARDIQRTDFAEFFSQRSWTGHVLFILSQLEMTQQFR